MAQTKQLIDTLKRSLKAHGLSYADVACQITLSEASVKRLFAEASFSLARLDAICQMMDMEISDLVLLMNNHSQSMLSFEQEQEIAADIALLLVTVCVLNRWTMPELMDHFHLSEHQCIRYLVVLDRFGLIDFLAGNRIKLKVAANFKWFDNGPIQQFFQQKVAADFFNTQFTGQQEQLIVKNGMLSDAAMAIFHRKVEQLAREFDELNNEDAMLPLDQRSGTTAVFAMRSWQYGLFERLRK
jgi:DNA-binding Xre family transcriptional regulator